MGTETAWNSLPDNHKNVNLSLQTLNFILRHSSFPHTSTFSAFEVSYKNTLYKFTIIIIMIIYSKNNPTGIADLNPPTLWSCCPVILVWTSALFIVCRLVSQQPTLRHEPFIASATLMHRRRLMWLDVRLQTSFVLEASLTHRAHVRPRLVTATIDNIAAVAVGLWLDVSDGS